MHSEVSHLSKLYQVSHLGLVVGVTNSASDLIALGKQLTDKLCGNEACSMAAKDVYRELEMTALRILASAC